LKNKPKICILSFSNIQWDCRALREIDMARQFYAVDVIGYGNWLPPEGVKFFSLERRSVFPPIKYFLLFLGCLIPYFFNKYFWLKPQYKQALGILNKGKYDLIQANKWDSLPVAVTSKNNYSTKIIFDVHEFNLAKNQYTIFPNIFIKYWFFLFSKYGSLCDKKITVSESIAELYRKIFPWEFDIILNAPKYQHINFIKTESDRIHIVHSGGAMPGRFLEEIISLMDILDKRFQMHFYLLPTYPKYLDKLKNLARKHGDRILFHEPVPPDRLVIELSQYNIGIHMIKAKSESYIYSLPNKFFDYIMAGLMIGITKFPVMVDFVKKFDIGIFTEDYSPYSLAAKLNLLDKNMIDKYRKNSIKLAKKYNAENEMEKLHQIYDSLLCSSGYEK